MIEDMKTLKESLNKLPDEVLEKFIVGVSDEGFELGCSEGEGEVEMSENYEKYTKAYPTLNEVLQYFTNLIEAVKNSDTDIGVITSREATTKE